jgi:methyl-accepting chemotaxis protein
MSPLNAMLACGAIGFVLNMLLVAQSYRKNVLKNINQTKDYLHALSHNEPVDEFKENKPTDKRFEALFDEIDLIEHEHTQIVNNLNGVVNTLNEASDHLSEFSASSCDRFRSCNLDSSRIANVIEEMSITSNQVAQNANAVVQAAADSGKEAHDGWDVVSKTAESIEKLSSDVEVTANVLSRLQEDSQNIGGVLEVIRNIAEQTNLLALNAAIEAARAGEQGRGFAVVADEVRTLASRTQQSTEDIQSMIERLQSAAREAVESMENSRIQAKDSVEQAAQAGNSLKSIIDAIATINSMSKDILNDAQDQTKSVNSVNDNISALNNITENTMNDFDETHVQVKQICSQAHNLKGFLNRHSG